MEKSEVDVKGEAIVIGGGIAGITAAQDLSRQKFKVHLVEKTSFLGGQVAERSFLSPWEIKPLRLLKDKYQDATQFRVTDTLITKSFVLLRIKLSKTIFDEIIELNEIARADRPALPHFNPFELTHPDISEIEFQFEGNAIDVFEDPDDFTINGDLAYLYIGYGLSIDFDKTQLIEAVQDYKENYQ